MDKEVYQQQQQQQQRSFAMQWDYFKGQTLDANRPKINVECVLLFGAATDLHATLRIRFSSRKTIVFFKD